MNNKNPLGDDWESTVRTGLFTWLAEHSEHEPFIYRAHNTRPYSAIKLVSIKGYGWRVMEIEERREWEYAPPYNPKPFYPTPELAVIAWKLSQ